MSLNNKDGLNLAPNIWPHRFEPQTASTLFDHFLREFGTRATVTALQLNEVGRTRSALFGVLLNLFGRESVQEFLQFREIHSGGP